MKTRVWLLALVFVSAGIVGNVLAGRKAFAQNPAQPAPSGAPQAEGKEHHHKRHKHREHKQHKRRHREGRHEDKEKPGESH
jgi:hypothetical protein